MFLVKDKNIQSRYIDAGKLSTEILDQIFEFASPGIPGRDLDEYAYALCIKNKVKPAFYFQKNSHNFFSHTICLTINEQAVHGIPTKKQVIQKDDVFTVDFGIIYKDLYTDHGRSYTFSENLNLQNFIDIPKKAVMSSLDFAKAGFKTGDISNALQSYSLANGVYPIRQFSGHGIGNVLHGKPSIPFYGESGTGDILLEGMPLAIELWVSQTSDSVRPLEDGWTYETIDKSKSAFFEVSLIVSKNDPIILC